MAVGVQVRVMQGNTIEFVGGVKDLQNKYPQIVQAIQSSIQKYPEVDAEDHLYFPWEMHEKGRGRAVLEIFQMMALPYIPQEKLKQVGVEGFVDFSEIEAIYTGSRIIRK